MKKVDIGRIYPHTFPQAHSTDKDIVDCSILDGLGIVVGEMGDWDPHFYKMLTMICAKHSLS